MSRRCSKDETLTEAVKKEQAVGIDVPLETANTQYAPRQTIVKVGIGIN